jgi:hypothetical protein
MAIKINGATVISDSQAFTSTSTVSATGNVTGGNVLTGGSISAAGNITGGNILGNVISTGPISTTGNVTGGNVLTGGLISATGNITGGNVSGTNLTGTLLTASQTNITAVGTLTSLNSGVISSSGNVTGANLLTSGLISAAGNVSGGNLNVTGNIVDTGPLSIITGSNGNIDLAPNGTGIVTVSSAVSATGNITGGNVSATNLTGTLATAAQPNITSVGTLTSLNSGAISSSGNVTGANLLTGGAVSATGDVRTAGSLSLAGNIVDSGPLTISTGSGDIALAPTGNVNISGKNINNLAQPGQNQDAATKLYVDNLVSTAISYHQPVLATTNTTLATATGGTITYSQPNGAGNGVGALLTTTGSFNLIDTANVQTVGTRVLVKNEANAVFNGVYTWANATNLVRATDSDTYGAGNTTAFGINDYYFTTSGNVNAGSAFVVSAPTGTVTFGTSNIAFAQFSSSQVYSANTNAGISLAGTVITGKVDGATTAFDVGGNIIVKASATLTTPNIGAATGTSLSVTGAVNAGTTISAAGNITGGNVSGTNLTGTLATAAQPNITSVGTLTSLNSGAISSSGNVTGANLLTSGLISATGNVSGGNLNVTGNIVDTGALSIITGSNGNIALAPNGTGIVTVSSALSVTGNVNGANIIGAHFGSGAGLTSIPNGALTNSAITVNGTSISLGGSGTITATATGTLTIGTGLGGTSYNGSTGVTITNTGVLSLANGGGITASVSTGAITLGSTATSANTAGAIVARGASGEFSAGVITGTATNARYADLAEKYTADAEYAPGTVLIFGGSAEVTVDALDADRRVAGVVSTNPGFLMNEGLDTEFAVAIALTGRVPCLVTGTVRKGDLMVSAGNGFARAESNPGVGTVIGKALEDHDGNNGVIEVVVGRF